MPVQAALPQIGSDVICCVGLGFLLAVLYDAGKLAGLRSRAVYFLLDNAAFLLAAILLCSFAAGRSSTGVVRWYMAAGLCAGLAAYFKVLAPAAAALRQQLCWLLIRPAVLLWLICRPLFLRILRAGSTQWSAFKQKCRNCRKKQQEKQLQKHIDILYNSN